MRYGWLAGIVACAQLAACDRHGAPEQSLPENTTRPDGQTIYSVCNHPSWSPDGTRITFVYRPVYPDRDAPDDVGAQDILIVGIDGSGLASLVVESLWKDGLKVGDRMHPYFPSWSPDGSRILFQADTFWTEDDPDTETEQDRQLFQVNVATREVQPLSGAFARGVGGSWSRDGSRIAFSRVMRTGVQTDQVDVWELHVATGEERRLTNDGQAELFPAYSPDGRSILFGASRGDIWSGHPDWDEGVWVMSADGSGKRPLLDSKEDRERSGAWSPDGRTVALATGSYTNGRIVVMPAEGGAPTVVAGPEPPLLLAADDPAWSPDGTKIAFCGDGEARFGLYVMNADGSEKRGIVPFEAAADVGK
jgi:Tol biopolymer transport system component